MRLTDSEVRGVNQRDKNQFTVLVVRDDFEWPVVLKCLEPHSGVTASRCGLRDGESGAFGASITVVINATNNVDADAGSILHVATVIPAQILTVRGSKGGVAGLLWAVPLRAFGVDTTQRVAPVRRRLTKPLKAIRTFRQRPSRTRLENTS